MANVGQWRASSVASNEPPAAPCKPDGPLRWLTKPSSDFWPTSSAGSGHIPDLKAFNRASSEFKVQSCLQRRQIRGRERFGKIDDAIGAFGCQGTGKQTSDFRADLEAEVAEGGKVFRAGAATPDRQK